MSHVCARFGRRPLLLWMGSILALHTVEAQPREPGQGWLAEFNHAAGQLLSLAEATPAEKFNWRPGPGVRSVSEVYMHIALGNYYLLRQAGVESANRSPMPADLEKKVTGKSEVIRWLRESVEAVRQTYPQADRNKKVKFFGQETTADGVFLRLLVHNHEHMGQSVAYARMMGVAPPWSQKEK